jgi:hypothetical protein
MLWSSAYIKSAQALAVLSQCGQVGRESESASGGEGGSSTSVMGGLGR